MLVPSDEQLDILEDLVSDSALSLRGWAASGSQTAGCGGDILGAR